MPGRVSTGRVTANVVAGKQRRELQGDLEVVPGVSKDTGMRFVVVKRQMFDV